MGNNIPNVRNAEIFQHENDWYSQEIEGKRPSYRNKATRLSERIRRSGEGIWKQKRSSLTASYEYLYPDLLLVVMHICNYILENAENGIKTYLKCKSRQECIYAKMGQSKP